MTTCEDMTFERLIAHIEEPGNDPALLRHLSRCSRCSARVIAVRMQSLALAALARHSYAREIDTASQSADSRADCPWEAAVDEHGSSWVASGPGACLGAARDAGLASFHSGLRELFSACLLSDPRRARHLVASARPRPIGEIVDDLACLARRLEGLGLTVKADQLPSAVPTPEQIPAAAAPVLEHIVALEGDSAWVARAREVLAGPA